jgi:hypothetical protein
LQEQKPNISDLRAKAIDAIAWSTLLAKWIQWAKASVALPDDAAGTAWKASLPHLISLQAITHAMNELADVVLSDRAFALERAEYSVKEHTTGLHSCWASEPLPESVATVIDTAQVTLARAQTLGQVFHVEHSGWIAPDPTYWAIALVDAGFGGDACALVPGTLIADGAPVAWCGDTDVDVPAIPDCGPPVLEPRPQMYRSQRDDGNWLDESVAFVDAVLAGRPLIIPVIEQGRIVFTFDAAQTQEWIEQQAAALPAGAPRLVVKTDE